MDLADRVAIVTGSSSGIGAEVARQLSEVGVRVIVNSASSVEAGEAVAHELPGEAVYIQADISDQDQGRRLIEAAVDQFGQLDILINNAGWTTQVDHSDLEGLTDEILQKTIEVNVFGTWWLTKNAMPHLSESPVGNVVMVTSVAGIRPLGSSIAYAMSKAALNHLTILLAKACTPVRVNAVAPGLIETPWTQDWDELHQQVSNRVPARRSGTPAEVARAVLALVSNSYVTGEITVVDGGLSSVM